MAEVIPLDPIPNQRLTARLSGRRYTLTLKAAGPVMAVTVERAGEIVVRGQRAVAGFPLIPYRYLEAGEGNFIFTCTARDQGAPWWENFGSVCQLVYTPGDELEALRDA